MLENIQSFPHWRYFDYFHCIARLISLRSSLLLSLIDCHFFGANGRSLTSNGSETSVVNVGVYRPYRYTSLVIQSLNVDQTEISTKPDNLYYYENYKTNEVSAGLSCVNTSTVRMTTSFPGSLIFPPFGEISSQGW